MKNILELLETSCEKYPDKVVFSDALTSVTYKDFLLRTRSVGSMLAKKGYSRKPVAVLLGRGVGCLTAMFGAVAGGCFYTVLDNLMPSDRMRCILDTLSPAAILTDEADRGSVPADFSGEVILMEDASVYPIDEKLLFSVRSGMIDTDPLYVLFTSGSTGVPKGAVLSHRNVLAYSEWFNGAFGIDENTVFGSQTPFYFSMSVSDVFGTVRAGASLHILDKTLFSFPAKLIEELNTHIVNALYWVPSALCIVANWKALDYYPLEHIRKVLFAGEVMPVRQLNYWRSKLPDALYANLFGPTETTDICTYYVVDRDFPDDSTLPIGYPCDNCGVDIIDADETGKGELIVRGSFLAAGYYGNPEKTAAAFTQNPFNGYYPEPVYRTGDLVRYNEYGELEYVSRKDFQIKHMGYRIELGEIEAAARGVEKINSCAVIYDKDGDLIVLIWEGKKCEDGVIAEQLRSKLPEYMMPNRYIRVKQMPQSVNGKIDRQYLKNNWKNI